MKQQIVFYALFLLLSSTFGFVAALPQNYVRIVVENPTPGDSCFYTGNIIGYVYYQEPASIGCSLDPSCQPLLDNGQWVEELCGYPLPNVPCTAPGCVDIYLYDGANCEGASRVGPILRLGGVPGKCIVIDNTLNMISAYKFTGCESGKFNVSKYNSANCDTEPVATEKVTLNPGCGAYQMDDFTSASGFCTVSTPPVAPPVAAPVKPPGTSTPSVATPLKSPVAKSPAGGKKSEATGVQLNFFFIVLLVFLLFL